MAGNASAAASRPLLGAHVPRHDPLGEASRRGAEVIQMNLSSPRTWATPVLHGDEDELAAADLLRFVHAPYLVNPASADPDVRARSRACLEAETTACARIGAAALVVHAGQPGTTASTDVAIDRWVTTMQGADLRCRLLVENTARGRGSPGLRPADLGRLVRALRAVGIDVGVVLDTCHAHAAGVDLATVVDELSRAAGGIDLVHANDARDPAGAGRDRHHNLGTGVIDPDELAAAALTSGAPVIVETPGGAEAQAGDLRWLRHHMERQRPAP